MLKFLCLPVSSAYSLRIREHIAWNVPVYIAFVSAGMLRRESSCVILVRSSEAALSVKVASIIFSGFTRFFWIRKTTRSTSVNVFPVPGPAIIRRGPLADVMASR